ncbi:hypothetical protein [Thermus tenuipuniceus]|uniref:hypothetical protein n=1 Tax=Thermus tenuipuniceus TaxID=2078690 RepID=UPI000CF8C3F0|nr:hypothetical protein [Thermus tenuipuniceus]
MRKITAVLWALALALAGAALADASDSKTFTVTVTAVESVQIVASLTEIDFDNTTTADGYRVCANGARNQQGVWIKPFCGVYPTINYSTNYSSNRQLLAKATVSGASATPVIVRFKKQATYVPSGPGQGGVWAFTGEYVDLGSTDTPIVTNIGSGSHAIGPVIEIIFDTTNEKPSPGIYNVTLTVTITAQ